MMKLLVTTTLFLLCFVSHSQAQFRPFEIYSDFDDAAIVSDGLMMLDHGSAIGYSSSGMDSGWVSTVLLIKASDLKIDTIRKISGSYEPIFGTEVAPGMFFRTTDSLYYTTCELGDVGVSGIHAWSTSAWVGYYSTNGMIAFEPLDAAFCADSAVIFLRNEVLNRMERESRGGKVSTVSDHKYFFPKMKFYNNLMLTPTGTIWRMENCDSFQLTSFTANSEAAAFRFGTGNLILGWNNVNGFWTEDFGYTWHKTDAVPFSENLILVDYLRTEDSNDVFVCVANENTDSTFVLMYIKGPNDALWQNYRLNATNDFWRLEGTTLNNLFLLFKYRNQGRQVVWKFDKTVSVDDATLNLASQQRQSRFIHTLRELSNEVSFRDPITIYGLQGGLVVANSVINDAHTSLPNGAYVVVQGERSILILMDDR